MSQPRLADLDSGARHRLLDRLNRAEEPSDLAPLAEDEARLILTARKALGPAGFADIAQIQQIDAMRGSTIVQLICSIIGRWEVLEDSPVYVVHGAVLNTERVLMFAGTAEASLPLDSAVWNPQDGQYSNQTYGHDLFCSHHAFLGSGDLLVNGGAHPGHGHGITQTYRFDPAAEAWTQVSSMNLARWYPTTLASPNDEGVITFSGNDENGAVVEKVEDYDQAQDDWNTLPSSINTTVLVTVIVVCLVITVLAFIFLGILGALITLLICIVVTIVTVLVTRTSPDKHLDIYPGMHRLPDGRIFYSGTRWASGSGIWSNPPQTALFDENTRRWTNVGAHVVRDRTEGMSVTLPPDNNRLLVIGGRGDDSSLVSTDSVEMIDFNDGNPAWQSVASMNDRRRNVNAVLLPTGRVLVCAGIRGFKSNADADPVLAAEEYDPEADDWTTMAAMTVPRLYHSVSLLLPDARVVNLGSVRPDGSFDLRREVEVYYPPYLCRGPRPAIDDAPSLVHHGQSFVIETPDASDIDSVVLVRPGASTHHTDSEQRVIPLTCLPAGPTELSATAPVGFQAIRGHYMLFILNGQGVPSLGRFLELH